MNIAFFGSSIVSSYWNGAATYYRGIVRALAERGHRVTFYEPDAFGRQQHRDIADPSWCEVVVYPPTGDAALLMVDRAQDADLVVKASGVGCNDALLEEAVLSLQRSRTMVAFWDVDAIATLDRIANDPSDPFRDLVPRYDIVFTYGGGPPVVTAYERFGARRCVPIYNALDPQTHHPVAPDPRFAGSLGFLGNRRPDREKRIADLFLGAAARLPNHRFLLGGAGWTDKAVPSNVASLGHVYSHDHNGFNVTPLAILDISRDFSPGTRVFEAAGAGACIITGEWAGIDRFLAPGREVLVARNGDDVAGHIESLTPHRARQLGQAAYARMLSDHTYAHRAEDIDVALGARPSHARATGADRTLSIVILGLSITSSWGNGHATTYRSLVRELAARGHRITFLERDAPWYADNRDLPHPPYARTALYKDLVELRSRFTSTIASADVVIVGSYVPDGIAVGRWVIDNARGVTAFYDIDTPVTLAQLDDGTCDYLAPNLVPLYRLYLSFSGGPLLQTIETRFGSPRARALYCSVDPELYAPEPCERRWDLGYMGTYSDDRQPILHRLLIEPARREQGKRFVVAGPQYPRGIEWPDNVERIEHLAPSKHRGFYNSCGFALNVTRNAMTRMGWSPSVRLFEAAACGTPIISDAWPGLDQLFIPGEEILIASTADDVLRFMRDVGNGRRAEIGTRGRARVLAGHTAAHRAAELEAHIWEVR